MANKKISQLPTAETPLSQNEIIPVVQSGATKSTTIRDVIDLVDGDLIVAELGYTPEDSDDKGKPSGYASLGPDGKVPQTELSQANIEGALGYVPEDSFEKGKPNGYASLDGGGKVPSGELSGSAITTALGYMPEDGSRKGKSNGYASLGPDGKVPASQLSGPAITAALGFTPENPTNKGVANGYASLDATGKVPAGQLPPIPASRSGDITSFVKDFSGGDMFARVEYRQQGKIVTLQIPEISGSSSGEGFVIDLADLPLVLMPKSDIYTVVVAGTTSYSFHPALLYSYPGEESIQIFYSTNFSTFWPTSGPKMCLPFTITYVLP